MKKLIAAAVAAAVLAPATVLASGPTLYGKLHLSIDMKDNNGDSQTNTKYDETSLNSNTSRIGVKGSEDLGNGMKVGYLIEWVVDMDGDSGNDLNTMNRGVTLSGDWGTALVGKWDTPFKTVGRKFDLFGDQVGDTRNLTELNIRATNVAAYVTPNMNGLTATVAYVFDSGYCQMGGAACSGDNSDANAWSFNAIYNNGPLMVALGYIDLSDDGLATTTAATQTVTVTGGPFPATFPVDTTAGTTTAAVGTDNATAWNVGASYKFGDFKVVGTYTDYESLDFTKDNDPSVWTLGGAYTMGNNVIKLQYTDRDESDSNADDAADMWSIGIDHNMSKRTTVYAAYATTDNDDNSARKSWGGGHDGEGAAAQGEDADAFSVGIIHKF